MNMATSTFDKKFAVLPNKANEFIKEMTKKVSPTLPSGFKSNFKHDKDIKNYLKKALN